MKFTFLSRLHSDDLARLILRVAVGGLMLFHGVDKIHHGVGGIQDLVEGAGMPRVMGYGVYVGEVLAPLLILIGLWTRPAALVLAMNMVVAVLLAHRADVLTITGHGAWGLELQALYFLGALALVFTGAGRWSVSRGKGVMD